MNILIMGAPGAGKGTQGDLLCRRLGIPKLSTGDMLRAEVANKTEIGLRVEALMPTGKLIDDQTVIDLLKDRIAQDDCRLGFMLDGFPRTLAQAQALVDSGVSINQIIVLDVDEDVIVERMSGRRFHPASGRTYHVIHNPPRSLGVDDVTGEPLIQRPDDEEETVRKRLAVYRDDTLPVLAFYEGLSEDKPQINRIKAMGSVDQVTADVDAALIGA